MSRVYTIHVGRVMVRGRVSVIYHRDRVIIGVNGRCGLCSSLTTANGFTRTQIVSHRRGRVPFTLVSDV